MRDGPADASGGRIADGIPQPRGEGPQQGDEKGCEEGGAKAADLNSQAKLAYQPDDEAGDNGCYHDSNDSADNRTN